ncbi:hypothetical protein DFP72DRAFT_1070229 [Ephemerocybe angulata]|uniref:Uncharacterized protein n=1 Tax=Ephemerocybe angulata TaxID=980116 RepID=A0A8H6M307_9AGAR|nr:hypothetical protein DFP72DRAFT_1070229 [Tulosesus angulatus]
MAYKKPKLNPIPSHHPGILRTTNGTIVISSLESGGKLPCALAQISLHVNFDHAIRDKKIDLRDPDLMIPASYATASTYTDEWYSKQLDDRRFSTVTPVTDPETGKIIQFAVDTSGRPFTHADFGIRPEDCGRKSKGRNRKRRERAKPAQPNPPPIPPVHDPIANFHPLNDPGMTSYMAVNLWRDRQRAAAAKARRRAGAPHHRGPASPAPPSHKLRSPAAAQLTGKNQVTKSKRRAGSKRRASSPTNPKPFNPETDIPKSMDLDNVPGASVDSRGRPLTKKPTNERTAKLAEEAAKRAQGAKGSEQAPKPASSSDPADDALTKELANLTKEIAGGAEKSDGTGDVVMEDGTKKGRKDSKKDKKDKPTVTPVAAAAAVTA